VTPIREIGGKRQTDKLVSALQLMISLSALISKYFQLRVTYTRIAVPNTG
jgi:hypothetical protein